MTPTRAGRCDEPQRATIRTNTGDRRSTLSGLCIMVRHAGIIDGTRGPLSVLQFNEGP